jgi:glycolate oxidase FAD binding subunit
MITNNDVTSALQEQVLNSIDGQQPLQIVGCGTKAFYGNETKGNLLHTIQHTGIIAYEPSELVVTVRTGTPTEALEAVLAEQGQMLAFEPPCLSPESTIGGAVAAGLSGPARAWRGAVRDHVLGVKLLTGKGKLASFGGQVMKNVAGYDISRLLAGSMGTLGVILEVSLKVVPKPSTELTLALEMPDREAFELTTALRRSTFPLSATCYFDGCLYLRLSGETSTIKAAHLKVGGEPLANPDQFWLALRNQTHEFFQQYDRPLWRLSFPPATNVVSRLEGNSLIEWGGSQRWVYTNIPVNLIRNLAERSRGHATLYRGRLPGVNTFQTLPPDMVKVQQRLKQAMDPHSIFNPGRMYKDW